MPRPRSTTALSWLASGALHAGLLGLGTLVAVSVAQEGSDETAISIRLSLPPAPAAPPAPRLELGCDDRASTAELPFEPASDAEIESALEAPREFALCLLEPVLETAPLEEPETFVFARTEPRLLPESSKVPASADGGSGQAGGGQGLSREGRASGGASVAFGQRSDSAAGSSRLGAGAEGDSEGGGGGSGSTPVSLEAPPPTYPKPSIRLGEEGEVHCALEIDSSGQVTSVVIETSSGHRRLDRAAIEALQRWRFAPARRDGIAIPVRIRHTVVFQLR